MADGDDGVKSYLKGLLKYELQKTGILCFALAVYDGIIFYNRSELFKDVKGSYITNELPILIGIILMWYGERKVYHNFWQHRAEVRRVLGNGAALLTSYIRLLIQTLINLVPALFLMLLQKCLGGSNQSFPEVLIILHYVHFLIYRAQNTRFLLTSIFFVAHLISGVDY